MTNVQPEKKLRITYYVLRNLDTVRHTPYSIFLIILAGFALRVYNLTYHSIWFDEAVSIRWAQSTLARILDVSMKLEEDRLPPLYYLLLKFWTQITGSSEFALRYLSVLCGVLLIAVVFVLGQKLFSKRVGLMVAMLTALSPFLIWYSQEARMYSLAVLLGALGVLFFCVGGRCK